MNEKQHRLVVYLPEDDYRKLRAKLAMIGLTVSGWLRKLIGEFINDIIIK